MPRLSAKIPHDNIRPNSNKARQRQPRAMIFHDSTDILPIIIFGSVSLYTAKLPFSHHAVIIDNRSTI